MAHTDSVVTLDRLQAISYRASDNAPSGRRRRFTNALVVVDARAGDTELRGLGEAQFRGRETGDRTDRSWQLLTEALHLLHGRTIDCSDRQTALASIATVMADLSALAQKRENEQRSKLKLNKRSARRLLKQTFERVGLVESATPFAGTLYGIETALLDVAARTLSLSVAGLLSDEPSPVLAIEPVRAGTTGTNALLDELRASSADLPTGVPLWLDFQRKLSYSQALRRVRAVARAAGLGEIGNEIIIRRALSFRDLRRRPALLREVEELVNSAPRPIRVTVATDVVGVAHRLSTLVRRTPRTRVIAVRPAASGGLVAAATMTRELRRSPGERLYISDVELGGPIAAAALRNLAAALPEPDGVVVSHHEGVSPDVQAGLGLDVDLPWEEIVDAVNDLAVVPEEPPTSGRQPNTYREVPFLQPIGPNGTKGHMMERQALARGMSTVRFSKGAFVANDGVHEPLLFKWSRSPLSSASALALCTHKEATRLRLGRAGVPVPKGRTFRNGDFDTAREFADSLGYPVVVKPAMGVRGIGVVAGIQDRTELDSAFDQLRQSKLGEQDFIVEKHISGKDYRIVVVGDKVIAAILRDPASVTGDGVHNVAELVIRKNATRRLNPHLWGRPILYGPAARYQLAKEGLTLESVPPAGQHVVLSNSCSLSQGGDSVDVLDELHPSVLEACVAAVKAIPGLAFCGVDFLLEDHRKPLAEQEAGICELNAHAAIGNCEYPTYGAPREVARTFMDACIERYQLDVSAEPAEELSLRLTVRGRVTGVGYRQWMRRHAKDYGLTGWVRNRGRRSVEVVITGETVAASALAAAAVLGPTRARPTSVTTEHVERPELSDFRIVQRPPQELASVR